MRSSQSSKPRNQKSTSKHYGLQNNTNNINIKNVVDGQTANGERSHSTINTRVVNSGIGKTLPTRSNLFQKNQFSLSNNNSSSDLSKMHVRPALTNLFSKQGSNNNNINGVRCHSNGGEKFSTSNEFSLHPRSQKELNEPKAVMTTISNISQQRQNYIPNQGSSPSLSLKRFSTTTSCSISLPNSIAKAASTEIDPKKDKKSILNLPLSSWLESKKGSNPLTNINNNNSININKVVSYNYKNSYNNCTNAVSEKKIDTNKNLNVTINKTNSINTLAEQISKINIQNEFNFNKKHDYNNDNNVKNENYLVVKDESKIKSANLFSQPDSKQKEEAVAKIKNSENINETNIKPAFLINNLKTAPHDIQEKVIIIDKEKVSSSNAQKAQPFLDKKENITDKTYKKNVSTTTTNAKKIDVTQPIKAKKPFPSLIEMEKRHSGEYVNAYPKEGHFICTTCQTPLFRASDKIPSFAGYATFKDYFIHSIKLQIIIPDAISNFDESFVALRCIQCDGFLGRIFQMKNSSENDDEKGSVSRKNKATENVNEKTKLIIDKRKKKDIPNRDFNKSEYLNAKGDDKNIENEDEEKDHDIIQVNSCSILHVPRPPPVGFHACNDRNPIALLEQQQSVANVSSILEMRKWVISSGELSSKKNKTINKSGNLPVKSSNRDENSEDSSNNDIEEENSEDEVLWNNMRQTTKENAVKNSKMKNL